MNIKNIQDFLILVGFSPLDSDDYYLVDLDMSVVNVTYKYLDEYVEKYFNVPKCAQKIVKTVKKEMEEKAQMIEKIEVSG